MPSSLRCALVLSLFAAAFSVPVCAGDAVPTAKGIGLTVIPLAPEDLDAMQRATGRRIGVVVTNVEEGSASAKAGLKEGDILLALGDKGVDSEKAADDALAGKSGALDIGILRITDEGNAESIRLTIELPAAAPARDGAKDAAGGDAKPAAGRAEIQAKLTALEDAHKAGILSNEEYAAKKLELQAELSRLEPPPDPEVRKKLTALDDAHKAGILSDEEYSRKKAALLGAGAAPDATPASAPAPAAKEPLIPATKSKVFRHAIGFEFVHPADWSVKEQGDILVLTPADPATGPEGALEIYLITGERVDTEGITRPDDARVTEFLDAQVKQIAPAFERTGRPGAIDTSSGKAVVLDWAARNPNGQELLARCYVNIIKGNGVTLTGIGIKDKILARDPVLRRMFTSFGMKSGKQDAALVGQWSLSGTTSLTNWSVYEDSWSRAKMVADSHTNLTLAADGRWTRLYESQMLAGGAGIWIESNDRKVSKGTWYAGDGVLYLVTDDDLWETYKYKIEGAGAGRRMRLASEKLGTLWKEAR